MRCAKAASRAVLGDLALRAVVAPGSNRSERRRGRHRGRGGLAERLEAEAREGATRPLERRGRAWRRYALMSRAGKSARVPHRPRNGGRRGGKRDRHHDSGKIFRPATRNERTNRYDRRRAGRAFEPGRQRFQRGKRPETVSDPKRNQPPVNQYVPMPRFHFRTTPRGRHGVGPRTRGSPTTRIIFLGTPVDDTVAKPDHRPAADPRIGRPGQGRRDVRQPPPGGEITGLFANLRTRCSTSSPTCRPFASGRPRRPAAVLLASGRTRQALPHPPTRTRAHPPAARRRVRPGCRHRDPSS